MKKILFAGLLLIVSSVVLNAQNGPLSGSGKIISKTVDYKDFDKISLTDLSGKVEIEVGKPFSIMIDIDDNLEPLLSVSNNNGKLVMELTGNLNNKMYIENTNIKIKISLPEISLLDHHGNDNVRVNGITGNNFRIEKSGNGDVVLSGTVADLEIKKNGNGNVHAGNLIAQQAVVRSSGNGDITVNAAKTFAANGSGNGDIKNIGAALASTGSSRYGNGDIIDPGFVPKVSPYPAELEDTRIKTRIQNKTGRLIELKVVYPVKGSYGIDIRPGTAHKEYFPLGTKIYKHGKMSKPLFEITPENRDSVLVIE
jgi:hypothetical protein